MKGSETIEKAVGAVNVGRVVSQADWIPNTAIDGLGLGGGLCCWKCFGLET